MITKVCTVCKKELQLEAFGKDKRGKYGVRSICKACRRLEGKEYREKNKEKIKANWHANKERYAESKKIYYQNNKERINEHNKNYYYKNIETEKERRKIYRETHKEEIKEYREAHKAKQRFYTKEYNMLKLRNYCISGQENQIENYELAKADNFIGWHRHHRLETHNSDGEKRLVPLSVAELKALDMYYNRPASELIWLTKKDHNDLHQSFKVGQK